MSDYERILSDYLLGLSSEAESRDLEQELENSAELRRQLKEMQELIVRYTPSVKSIDGSVKDRILNSVGEGTRYSGFAPRLAELFDVSTEFMQNILQQASNFPAQPWEPSLVPDMHALHFQGGARMAGAECGVVHMLPGTVFPPHNHDGSEGTFILQGEFSDDDGTVYLPGDVFYKDAGQIHSYQATGDVPLVFLVFHNGISIEK